MIDDKDNHFKPRRRYEPTFKYDDTMPDEAYKILASGFSDVATAGKLGISPKTFISWKDTYPEFDNAVKAGKAAGRALWEELAQNPEHSQFDSKVYAFNMSHIYKSTPGVAKTKSEVSVTTDRAHQILDDLVKGRKNDE